MHHTWPSQACCDGVTNSNAFANVTNISVGQESATDDAEDHDDTTIESSNVNPDITKYGLARKFAVNVCLVHNTLDLLPLS